MNHASLLRSTDPRPASRSALGLALVACVFALALVGDGAPARADALKDGKNALASGQFDDAVAAYRSATEAAPNDAQAWLGLGLALEKKRQWQAALNAFQKASALDARLADPFRGEGSMLLRLEQVVPAEAAFRKAIDIDRKFPAAQIGLGEALVRQKRIPEAIAVYEQGVKFGSKTAPEFFKGLGEAEAARDSVRDAEIWLLKAREAAKNMSASVRGSIFRALGDLYMQRKIPSLAIQNYQEAKAIDESDLDTRMALGDAYYRGALFNDALGEYSAVVDADPKYAEGYYKLGNLYVLASQSDPQRVFQAIETLEKLLELEPDHINGKALLAQAHFRTGGANGRERARVLLDELEKTGKFPADAWRTRGIIQYEAREYEPALASFARAPLLETIDLMRIADTYRRLAVAVPETARKDALYGSADSVYVAIVARDSSSADAKRAQDERAKLLYLRGKHAEAVEVYKGMILLDPNNAEAYYYWGLSERARGDDAAGLVAIQKAVELDPGQAGWWLQLGAAHSKLKALPEARLAFQKSAELDSSTTVGAVARQQLGYYALLDKDWAAAVRYLEESVRVDDTQYQSWLWLGQAQQNAGNVARAVESYRKVQEQKPGEPNSAKGLKSLGK